MKFKPFHWMMYRAFEAVFFFFLGLLYFLPINAFQKIAHPFLRLTIYLAIPTRRVVKNLAGAFGRSYSDATKHGLAKGVQEHFARNLMDCFLQLGDSDYARAAVKIRGIENLHAALAKGRGVIALGAHIGNFVLLGTRLGIEGHPFHTLFRMPPDRRIRNVIFRFLPRFHQRVIPSLPRRVAVRRILDRLKNNEIVFILGDNLKKGAISALLFGQRVPSPRGPISLALRSQAPLLPMYLVRSYDGGLDLVIEPELELTFQGNLPQAIEENTRRVVCHLENLIRRYPDQWNWLTVRMSSYQADSAAVGDRDRPPAGVAPRTPIASAPVSLTPDRP